MEPRSRIGVQYKKMRSMRFRWLLPLCNLAIDAVLLCAMVWIAHNFLAARDLSPLWHQTTGEHFDPALLAEAPFPQPIKAIALGTLPAAIVPSLFLPNGWRGSSPFDLLWVGLHLTLAVVFWYGIGRLVETDHLGLRRVIVLFVVLRVTTIPISLSLWNSPWGMVRDLILVVCWLGAAVFLAVRAIASLTKRIESWRRAKAV